jgi:hypothetical protein
MKGLVQASAILCALALGVIVPTSGSAAQTKIQPGSMHLTGYQQVGPSGSTGPSDVRVSGKKEAAIYAALTHLPSVPPTGCEETEQLFSITFLLKSTTHPAYLAIGDECPTPGVVQIRIGGRAVGDYKLDCPLKKVVLVSLPLGRDVGSRANLQGCP